MTKVCIVGAGAIGGFIGTRLAAAGRAQVSALARGKTLRALQTQGWRMQTATGLVQAPAHASDNAAELGLQDWVVIAVKGPALTQAVRSIAPLIGPDTLLIPAMNGVPWWFCQGLADFPGGPLDSVDPGGHIAAVIPFAQVLGCVVHASTATSEPGLVQHKMGQGLIVGEPMGNAEGFHSARVQQVVDLLSHAGFDATPSGNVRYDIWYKLWGNMTMNPVSAVTGASADRILADPLVRNFCSAVMLEAQGIGARIGCPIAQDAEDRHTITAKLGAFKTSMLQDAEAGRPLELDAIVGVVREIGQRLGLATPHIDTLFGLARLFGRVHGLYPDAIK
jgi:2-dehydropantoate 2-reductase